MPHQTQQNRECHWPPENIVHHPEDIKRAQSFQKVDIPLALTVGGLFIEVQFFVIVVIPCVCPDLMYRNTNHQCSNPPQLAP